MPWLRAQCSNHRSDGSNPFEAVRMYQQRAVRFSRGSFDEVNIKKTNPYWKLLCDSNFVSTWKTTDIVSVNCGKLLAFHCLRKKNSSTLSSRYECAWGDTYPNHGGQRTKSVQLRRQLCRGFHIVNNPSPSSPLLFLKKVSSWKTNKMKRSQGATIVCTYSVKGK